MSQNSCESRLEIKFVFVLVTLCSWRDKMESLQYDQQSPFAVYKYLHVSASFVGTWRQFAAKRALWTWKNRRWFPFLSFSLVCNFYSVFGKFWNKYKIEIHLYTKQTIFGMGKKPHSSIILQCSWACNVYHIVTDTMKSRTLICANRSFWTF